MYSCARLVSITFFKMLSKLILLNIHFQNLLFVVVIDISETDCFVSSCHTHVKNSATGTTFY